MYRGTNRAAPDKRAGEAGQPGDQEVGRLEPDGMPDPGAAALHEEPQAVVALDVVAGVGDKNDGPGAPRLPELVRHRRQMVDVVEVADEQEDVGQVRRRSGYFLSHERS